MLPVQWISKIANDKEKKEEFETLLRGNSRILEVLIGIIDERENSLLNTLFSLSSPSDQRDNLVGRIAELRDLKKLLNI